MTIAVKNIDRYNRYLKENENVFVLFSSSGCAPCRQMKPYYDRVSKETPEAKFLVMMESNNTEKILDSNNIMCFPTLIFFKNGKKKKSYDRYIGYRDLKDIVKKELK